MKNTFCLLKDAFFALTHVPCICNMAQCPLEGETREQNEFQNENRTEKIKISKAF